MEQVKKIINPIVFDRWWENHHRHGGLVCTSYVDWDLLADPLPSIIQLLEDYRQVPLTDVMAFNDAHVFDNDMPYRNVLEDGSKILYLVGQVQFLELKFNPQLLHEPWYDRYRVHPGSGRLQALWLCGYESIKTIYLHFNEPGFVIPEKSFIIDTPQKFYKECCIGVLPNSIDIEMYPAFPKTKITAELTKDMDSEWHYENLNGADHWNFIRYSEGRDFVQYKYDWRTFSLELWEYLQHEHIQLGDTEFYFDAHGKVRTVYRKGECIFAS